MKNCNNCGKHLESDYIIIIRRSHVWNLCNWNCLKEWVSKLDARKSGKQT
jgi:hypothetical protein